MPENHDLISRRTLLVAGGASAAALLIGGCDSSAAAPAGDPDGGAAQPDAGLEPTPECGEETEDNLEGPFYRAGAPERADLTEPDMLGTRLTIRGTVFSTSCAPLAGAVLDVWQADWQADETGAYDAVGWRLRGVLNADRDGGFAVTTIIPGRYLNGDQFRPAHIHVKASADGHALLTTQLYVAGDPFNDVDPFIEAPLIMTLEDDGDGGKRAGFDFVLRPA